MSICSRSESGALPCSDPAIGLHDGPFDWGFALAGTLAVTYLNVAPAPYRYADPAVQQWLGGDSDRIRSTGISDGRLRMHKMDEKEEPR